MANTRMVLIDKLAPKSETIEHTYVMQKETMWINEAQIQADLLAQQKKISEDAVDQVKPSQRRATEIRIKRRPLH